MTNTQTAAPVLVIRRTFDAPRERVFAAFTTPELLRDWFGPAGNRIGEVTFEARSGGRYRIEMQHSSGEDFNVGGVITEFRPPEFLAYTFRWEEDDPALERDTNIRVEFIDRGKQTEIVFTHENLASEASRDSHAEGWNGSLDRLDALVGPPIGVRGIDLSGYMCKDAKRAMAWYRNVFGLEPSLVYPEDRGGEYDLPDGTTFGLWGGGGKVMPFQPSNGVMFAVDDITAAQASLAARGIPVIYATETPLCRMAMINDSEGNIITLHQRK